MPATCTYFDIDAILAEEERVQAEFAVDAYGMGYLDPSKDPSTEPDVTAGSKLDLPYWLIQPLVKRNWVEFQFPKAYHKHFREQVKADSSPQVLTLHDKSPYYEDFGLQMAKHVCERADEGEQVDEAREVYLAIQGAIVNRSQHLLSLSENSCNEDTSGLMKGLTEREKTVFSLGQNASRLFRSWKDRDSGTITKVQVGKKRSRGTA